MEYRPHHVFRKNQYTVTFELPNDVFFDFMTLHKQVNKEIQKIEKKYKLTEDDILCIALEDFIVEYLGENQKFMQRLNVI